jgi:hypothetical protein
MRSKKQLPHEKTSQRAKQSDKKKNYEKKEKTSKSGP